MTRTVSPMPLAEPQQTTTLGVIGAEIKRSTNQPLISAAHARRKANGYLGMYVGMFFGGSDVVFVPGNPPLWQVAITFQMYDVGPFTLGAVDVNAWTGAPLPLSDQEIRRIQERTNAIVGRCESTSATAG